VYEYVDWGEQTIVRDDFQIIIIIIIEFTLVLNYVLFWKLLVDLFLLGTSEALLCSSENCRSARWASAAKFIETLEYLEPKLFGFVIFYRTFTYIEILILFNTNICLGSRDSTVGIATGFVLDGQGIRVRVPVGTRFSPPHVVQAYLSAHPASYPMDTGGKAGVA
jgi:hypothetical protein